MGKGGAPAPMIPGPCEDLGALPHDFRVAALGREAG